MIPKIPEAPDRLQLELAIARAVLTRHSPNGSPRTCQRWFSSEPFLILGCSP